MKNIILNLVELIEFKKESKKIVTDYISSNGMEEFFKNYNSLELSQDEKHKIEALIAIIDIVAGDTNE